MLLNCLFLREALFTSGSAKLDLSVRPYVWIIIDFRDWDMEGDEALLLIGSLNYDFGRSEQKLKTNLQKQALATGIRTFRDTDLSRFWTRFGVIFQKTNFQNITDLALILRPLGDLDEDELELTWSGVGPDWSPTVHSRM